MRTNDMGYVERLSMESVSNLTREMLDRGLQGESNMALRSCRKLLLEFCEINDYAISQVDPDNMVLCNVSCYVSVVNLP